MRTQGMDDLRLVLLGLSEGGKREVATATIHEVLGARTNSEQVMVCRRMAELAGRGEAQRVSKGVYRYIPSRADDGRSLLYRKIYRAIRVAKPGWTLADIVLVSGTWEKICRAYVNHLIVLGLVDRQGKSGNTLMYRTTKEGLSQRETPILPHEPKDPHAREKSAALAVVHAFLTGDPWKPAARAKIVECCKAILARFEKEEVADHEDA